MLHWTNVTPASLPVARFGHLTPKRKISTPLGRNYDVELHKGLTNTMVAETAESPKHFELTKLAKYCGEGPWNFDVAFRYDGEAHKQRLGFVEIDALRSFPDLPWHALT